MNAFLDRTTGANRSTQKMPRSMFVVALFLYICAILKIAAFIAMLTGKVARNWKGISLSFNLARVGHFRNGPNSTRASDEKEASAPI